MMKLILALYIDVMVLAGYGQPMHSISIFPSIFIKTSDVSLFYELNITIVSERYLIFVSFIIFLYHIIKWNLVTLDPKFYNELKL